MMKVLKNYIKKCYFKDRDMFNSKYIINIWIDWFEKLFICLKDEVLCDILGRERGPLDIVVVRIAQNVRKLWSNYIRVCFWQKNMKLE